MDLGFRIPIVSGIPDSYSFFADSKPRIPDSTSRNFHFRIQSAKVIRFPLHGAKCSFWRALDSKTNTTTSTRFSQYKVMLAGEPASFGRENAGAQYS